MDTTRFLGTEQRLWASVGVTPAERRVQLAGQGIDARVLEVGDGAPVLFVHGASNAGSSWSTLVRDLDGVRCVLMDRPGCGLSDPLRTKPADVDALGAYGDTVLVEVLDALGIERAHLVATSYGGYLALRTAAAHSDRVDRVLLFGWAFGASAPPLSLRLSTIPAVGKLLGAMPQNEWSVRSLLKRIGLREALASGRFTPAMLDWYVSLLRDTDTLRNEAQAGPRLPVGAMDDRALLPAELLGRVSAPVHLFWGEDDPFGGTDVAHAFASLLPDATLELVAGAGHAPWIDEPARAATATRALLGRYC